MALALSGLIVAGIVTSAHMAGSWPSSWPTAHYQSTNNGAPPSSIAIQVQYRRSFPVLLNSDTPIVNGRLYVVGGNTSPARDAAHPGYIWALDARTGTILWTATTPNSVFAEPVISHGRVLVGVGNALFPASSGRRPALDSGAVRGLGTSGLFAYNAATGWPVFEFGTSGADQAPATVVGNRVYLASGDRRLYALRISNGEPVWSVNLGHYVSRSSPRIVDGLAVVGGAGPLGMVAVSLKTHQIAWQRPIAHAVGGVDDTTLAVSGDRLVGAGVIQKASGVPFSAVVYAINGRTGTILWEHSLAKTTVLPRYKETGTPLIVGHGVYVGNALNGTVTALSMNSGKVLWRVNAGSPVTRPPTFSHGRIWVMTQTGVLEGITLSGHLDYQRRLGHFVNAYGPVVLGDTAWVTANTATHGVLIAVTFP